MLAIMDEAPPNAAPGTLGYFASRSHGSLWVGNVPTPGETQAILGVTTRSLAALRADLDKWSDRDSAVLTGVDPTVDAQLPRALAVRAALAAGEIVNVEDPGFFVDRRRHDHLLYG